MFQQPNYSDPGKHISTSSSVYPDSNSASPESSPRIPGAFEQIIIPRHKENPFRTNKPIEQQQQQQHQQHQEHQANGHDEEQNRMPTEGSNQTFQSYMTARSGAYSFEEEDYENEVAEHQDQQSENGSIYSQNQEPQLRNAPSFSSINESIFHNSSKNTTLDTTENDETPLIDSSERYPDETPIVDDNGFLHEINHGEKDIIASEPIDSNEPTSLLPKQNLSKKFKRVSVALQNTRTSGESYNFRNVFQNNVDQANRTATQDNTAPKLERKSTYYRKLQEKKLQSSQEQQGTEVENMVISNDQHSEASSISTRASSTHTDTSGRDDEQDDNLVKKNSTNSSSNFVFSNNNLPSSYNLGGSKVNDDIPIRKDLIRENKAQVQQDAIDRERLQMYNNSTAMSEEGGLNIVYKDANTTSDDTYLKPPSPTKSEEKEDNLSDFFIRALHSFDSSTLQSKSDASICLSFEKNDIAFLHTIDESGWGEVTLLETLQTGWIPMNYFSLVVTSSDDEEDEDDSYEDNDDDDSNKIPNNHYLKPLLHACGQFLSNPLSHKDRRNKYTFSIRVINSIRDGVRLLLQQTDCLSRSNELVTKRPIVRKSRKSLLADWYNLMVKANEFKGTSNYNKIEILTLMVYQVSRKAVSFLEIWSAESKEIITRDHTGKKLYDDLNDCPLLKTPPLAKQRITEIHGVLFSYLGLIIGRLDLIEHNQIGCDMLETLAHQIILLLRELLFVSRTGSEYSKDKPRELDSSLDGLLSLVSDLVASVKNLVVRTVNETEEDRIHKFGGPQLNGARDYYYTPEGGELLQIASRMVKAISVTVASIRKLLEVTGDFKLSSERSYPDYSKMRIEPQEFIKKCSQGITKPKDMPIQQPNGATSTSNSGGIKAYKANRYSMIRAGKTGDLGLTENGVNYLQSLNNENGNGNNVVDELDGSSPFTLSAPEFKPFTSEGGNESNNDANINANINNELSVDSNGNLLGGSFKGLVYTLTNEDLPPEYFFVSTFFICFRSFSTGIDLIEELITRFQVGYVSNDINIDLKLKKRRKLVAKLIQLWMESYWNHEADYNLLTTLINFFNEGMSDYLPLDAIRLIDIGARLSSRPLVENRSRRIKDTKQLVNRSITNAAKLPRKTGSILGDEINRYSMIDSYSLSKINSTSSSNSTTSSSGHSASLPMPLGPTSTSKTSLLTSSQLETIEKVNLTYRAILGNSWCSQKYINSIKYIPLDLSVLMPNFYIICDQSWVLSNYRPNLLDFNGLEIAKQLTLLESYIFCSIKPDELLNQNYTTKRAHLKLAPNVRLSLLFTNCLSGYVIESILQPNITIKLRISMVKIWLKIAISCLYLRNFNSLAAIITALESHLITRISSIWIKLEDKYTELYDYLSSIIHPEKNYRVYRNKLRNFLNSPMGLETPPIPIVPYFSLFLQDLTFINDGNPNYRKANTFLNQKLINIDKYLKITRIIADIECLQISYLDDPNIVGNGDGNSLMENGDDKPNYTINPVAPLQELILLELWKICQLNKTEEDRAWKLSCKIQPRDVS